MIKSKDYRAILLMLLTTGISSYAILQYCDLFYELGMLAKNRLLESPIRAFFVPPIFFWISAYLCRKYARSSAGNTASHIEASLIQLKKTPESFGKHSAPLNFRCVMVNAFSSLISTFGGGSLGREGPSVYMSASFFAVIAQKAKKFIPKINFENWVLAGSAAGFAIAFHAPLAGFIYVVEKLFHHKSKNFVDNIFWTTVALFAVIIVLHKTDPLFEVYKLDMGLGIEIVVIALIAMVCGILSFFSKEIAVFLYSKVDAVKGKSWHLIPIIAGFMVSIITIYGGAESFSGGIQTARDALSGEVDLTYTEVGVRILNTVITFVSGCAGGLVAPAVAIGSGIGSIFSHMMENIDAKIFILSGMASFLCPVLGLPFVTAMVILETSSQPILAFTFLFFSSGVSFLTTKLILKLRK